MDITRIEIALLAGNVVGAQVSLDTGRTVGVDTGNHLEYSTKLSDVLGAALSSALAQIVELQEANTSQVAALQTSSATIARMTTVIASQKASMAEMAKASSQS
jgi:hypothetical protein